MPDWTTYIREHLPRDGFRGELEGEILEELAGHLEDAYREALARGASPAEAERAAVAEIGDWEELAKRILRSRSGAKSSRAARNLEESEARMRFRGGLRSCGSMPSAKVCTLASVRNFVVSITPTCRLR